VVQQVLGLKQLGSRQDRSSGAAVDARANLDGEPCQHLIARLSRREQVPCAIGKLFWGDLRIYHSRPFTDRTLRMGGVQFKRWTEVLGCRHGSPSSIWAHGNPCIDGLRADLKCGKQSLFGRSTHEVRWRHLSPAHQRHRGNLGGRLAHASSRVQAMVILWRRPAVLVHAGQYVTPDPGRLSTSNEGPFDCRRGPPAAMSHFA
jgi:hypothetical protein